MDHLIIDMLGAHGAVEKTSSGGVIVPANLTRTGVFTYVYGGKVVRELRPPEEVLSKKSLDTLAHCSITVWHPTEREVTRNNYRNVNVGQVHDVKVDGGKYVAGKLVIQDGETADRVLTKELCEISCGYRCDYDETPGTWQGQPYDRVQRNIRYNHLSLLPKGAGRAGEDVGVKLDGEETSYIRGMDNVSAIINDSKDGETPAPAQVVIDMSQFVPVAKFDQLQAAHDALKSENVALKADNQLKTDAASPAALDALVATRAALFTDARVIAGKDFAPKGTALEIMSAALAVADPSLKLDGKSSDYVQASFDLRVAARKGVVESHTNAADISRSPVVTDQDDEDPLAKAQAEHNKRFGR